MSDQWDASKYGNNDWERSLKWVLKWVPLKNNL